MGKLLPTGRCFAECILLRCSSLSYGVDPNKMRPKNNAYYKGAVAHARY